MVYMYHSFFRFSSGVDSCVPLGKQSLPHYMQNQNVHSEYRGNVHLCVTFPDEQSMQNQANISSHADLSCTGHLSHCEFAGGWSISALPTSLCDPG